MKMSKRSQTVQQITHGMALSFSGVRSCTYGAGIIPCWPVVDRALYQFGSCAH